MPVVTLSREYGAGGLTVGPRVAELLRADFLDSTLIEEVARRLHLPEEAVGRWDERREGVILRLLRALQAAHPEYAPSAPVVEEALQAAPDPDRIWGVVQEVIREEARSDRAVIMGRGGAFILAGWPGAHHFRLVAPREARVRHEAEHAGITGEEAARRVDAADRERNSFLRHHFGVDPRDPVHYALVLNTEVLGYETAARIIAQVSGAPAA